ncbi:hypothetical protein [Legionella moravica]|uniref:hypothetical protein n=1 Tax=Legionella moravica TaxID=39962 RepID=UPI0011C07340|nr:hypothetical protein [Legionella moravica]
MLIKGGALLAYRVSPVGKIDVHLLSKHFTHHEIEQPLHEDILCIQRQALAFIAIKRHEPGMANACRADAWCGFRQCIVDAVKFLKAQHSLIFGVAPRRYRPSFFIQVYQRRENHCIDLRQRQIPFSRNLLPIVFLNQSNPVKFSAQGA